jgi:hypothetical protein
VSTRTYGVVPPDVLKSYDGLGFLKAIINRTVPNPPISELLGFHLVEVEEGRAVFEGTPEFRHYNPIGTVHGGFAATLLDSALGCVRDIFHNRKRRYLDHPRTQIQSGASDEQGHWSGAGGRPHRAQGTNGCDGRGRP